MADSLTLVSNPGSASRKYALFSGATLRASLHFEWHGKKIICTLSQDAKQIDIPLNLPGLKTAADHVQDIFYKHGALGPGEYIGRIGLRVVAPGAYFTQHRVVNQHLVNTLQAARPRAPLHVTATLEELRALHLRLPHAVIVGVSDSAFHANKPIFAQHYSVPPKDADKLDIKRFGYHGLSAESVVTQLKALKKLTRRLLIVHLGSGASITAVYNGKSVDNTMGYSPLEGLTMATRSGSIDFTAVRALKAGLGINDTEVEDYLNKQSGLLGLGGSGDIRRLLALEEKGSAKAKLALQIYIFNVQKGIGQMAGALGGVDQLVFTGTVGERNPQIRQRVADGLHYLDFLLGPKANRTCSQPKTPVAINRLVSSKPVFVVPADEAQIIARVTNSLGRQQS